MVLRPRLDTGKDIFTQLTSVLSESCAPAAAAVVTSVRDAKTKKNNDGDMIIIHKSASTENPDNVRIHFCHLNFTFFNYRFILAVFCSSRPCLLLKTLRRCAKLVEVKVCWKSANRSPSYSATSRNRFQRAPEKPHPPTFPTLT